MAGDWIKLEHATPDKPEVFRMAALLQIDPDTVVGKLARLWVWCDQQSINGKNLAVTDSFIDRVTHQPGFSAALREVSWLSARSGSLTIPNFDRHNGQTAKARALALDRKKKQRGRGERDSCHDAGVTKAGPEIEVEIEKKSEPPKPPPLGVEPEQDIPLPNVLLTEAFKAKWAEYIAYRRKRHLPTLLPDTIRRQWNKLASYGHEGAIASLDQTMDNQWQGLFAPKEGAKPGETAAPVRFALS